MENGLIPYCHWYNPELHANQSRPYCHWYNPELHANQSRLLNPALAQKEKQLTIWNPVDNPSQNNEGDEENDDTCKNLSMSEDSENQIPVKSPLFVPAKRKKKPCLNNDQAK